MYLYLNIVLTKLFAIVFVLGKFIVFAFVFKYYAMYLDSRMVYVCVCVCVCVCACACACIHAHTNNLDTIWRETLEVGKFGELSAKVPLVK